MKKFFPLVIIAILFIVSSFLSQQYIDFVHEFILQHKISGFLIYILTVIIAITIAPLSSIPLIPVLVSVWGVFLTTALSILGWTLGSIVAFWIARTFGLPIVGRLVSLEKIEKRYAKIPEKNLFWYLIFLRMTVPVDILSYTLGMFTNIKWGMFISTTFLGVIPVILLLSFFGTFPAKYQAIVFSLGIFIIFLFLFIKKPSNKELPGD